MTISTSQFKLQLNNAMRSVKINSGKRFPMFRVQSSEFEVQPTATATPTPNSRLLTVSLLIALLLTLFSPAVNAQFDTKHYLPPVWTGSTNTDLRGNVNLVISTSSGNDVEFNVYYSNGTPLTSGTCKSGAPNSICLGNNFGVSANCPTTPCIAYGVDSVFTELYKRGLIVEANEPVCVSIIENTAKSDRWSITSKGQTALGQDFYTGQMYDNINLNNHNCSNIISIMATEDATKVKYTLNSGVTLTNGKTGPITDSITLNAGQSYVIRASTVGAGANEALNGTHITSNNDIVVMSGTYVAYTSNSGDTGYDELVPVKATGSEYGVQYGNVTSDTYTEQVNVVAAYDNTAIFVDSTYMTTIDAGENERIQFSTYSKDVTGTPMLIQLRDSASYSGTIATSRPRQLAEQKGYVYQESGGGQGERGMSIIPSLQCKGTLYSEFQSLASTANLNIVAMTGAEVYLNGSSIALTPISGYTDVPIGDASYDFYSTITGTTGEVTVESDKLMHVGMMYGTTTTGLFAYYTNFTSPPLLQLGTVNYSQEGNYLYASGMFTKSEWFYNGKSLGIKTVSGIRDSIEVSLPGTYSVSFTTADCGCTDTCSIVVSANPNGPYPGGAEDGVLWLRADKENSDANYWGNYAGAMYLDSVVASGEPTLTDNVINFNPAYVFDGDDYFDVYDYFKDSAAVLNIGNDNNAREVIAVAFQSGGTNGTILNLGETVDSSLNFMSSYGANRSRIELQGTNLYTADYTCSNAATFLFDYYMEPEDEISNFKASGFGAALASAVSSTGTSTIPLINDHKLAIGRSSYSSSDYFTGQIAEVIYFHDTLSTTERSRVNSYLAIKYGITLDQTSPNDYLASDSAEVWDADINTVYNNYIFGIGLDSVSALDQRVSKSINDTTVLTIALENDFTTSNLARTTTFTDDLQFLMMGSNDGYPTVNDTSELPSSGDYNIRMTREWLVQPTGTAQDVYLKFDSCYTKSTITCYMLVDDDGDFTTGNIAAVELDEKGVVTAPYQFTSDVYITVVAYRYCPGGVPQDLALWMRADKLTGTANNGDGVHNWGDFSSNADTVYDEINQPTLSIDALNFNPGLNFTDKSGQIGYNLGSHYIFSESGDYHIIAVGDFETTTSDYNFIYDFGAHAGKGVGFGLRNSSSQIYTYETDSKMFGANIDISNPALVEVDYGFNSGGLCSLFKDGESIFSTGATNSKFDTTVIAANFPRTGQTGPVSIGRQSKGDNITDGGSRQMMGDLGEVIVYTGDLDGIDAQKIRTYLAVKYGITLDQSGSGTDYIASNGDTIWSVTDNAATANSGAYNHNIFGLGRDDVAELNQLVSHSIDTPQIDLKVAMDLDFTTSNTDHLTRTTSIDNDISYLMFSDNGADTTFNDTIYNGLFIGMDHTWRFTQTNISGQKVNLNFGLRYASNDTIKYYAVYKPGDDDFTTGAYHHEIDEFGNVASVSTPADGYFTIMRQEISSDSPGGVKGARLWLRGDEEVTASGNKASQWVDYSKHGYVFTQGTTAQQPGYGDSLINYNYALYFDESNKTVMECNGQVVESLYGAHQTVFTVAHQQNANRGIVYYVSDSITANYELNNVSSDAVLETAVQFDATGVPKYYVHDDANLYLESGAWASPLSNPVLSTITHDSLSVSVWLNSDNQNTVTAAASSRMTRDSLAHYSRVGGFGSTDAGADYTKFFTGKIGEVIAFTDSALSNDDIQKIESYLAVKYGITLDQNTSETDYLMSDSSVFWDASLAKSFDASTDYNNDIFGLARDDASDLYQRISKSVNDDAILTVSRQNDFTSPNDSTYRKDADSYIADLAFLMIGNNDSSVAITKTDELPAGVERRMHREWMVQKKNNFINPVSLKFDGDFKVASSAQRYILIADDDGDGDFSTGIPKRMGTLDSTGVVADVDFDDLDSDNVVITVGYVENFAPGGIATDLWVWMRADMGTSTTTNGIAVDYWDEMGRGNMVWRSDDTPSDANRHYIENISNFNPAVQLIDGDMDLETRDTVTAKEFFVVGQFTSQQSNAGIVGFNNGSEQFGIRTVASTTTLEYNNGSLDAEDWYNGGVFRLNESTANYAHNGRFHLVNARRPDAYKGLLFLGGYLDDATNYGFDGYISEVVAYSTDISDIKRQKIQSYLALKHGISLDQSTPYSYLASDSTVMWESTNSSVFTQDIFGLGRDDTDSLYQRVSKSVNSTAVLTVALNSNFTAANLAASRKSDTIANLNFMTFSHNGGDTIADETDNLPANHIAYRMERIWRVSETSEFPDSINMKFDVPNTGALTYLLYKTTGTDGDFTSGTVTYVGRLDVNGEIPNVKLDSGEYFSLFIGCSPGGVTENLQLWLRADYLTEKWTSDNRWYDFHNIDTCTVMNGATLNTTTGLHNFNPGVSFDGTDDYIDIYDGFSDFTEGQTSFALVNQDTGVAHSQECLFDLRVSSLYPTTNQGAVSMRAYGTNACGIAGYSAYNDTGEEPCVSITPLGEDYLLSFNFNDYTIPGNTINAQFFKNGSRSITGQDDELRAPNIGVRNNNYIGYGKLEDGGTGLGNDNVAADYFAGDIPEVIIYNRKLSAVEQLRVETYMAIKYGISLSNDNDGDGTTLETMVDTITEGDYITSDSTVIWDATKFSTFQNQIAGIGTDSIDMLIQRISQSDLDSTLTIAYDADFVSPNMAVTRTTMADTTFVVVGSTDADTLFESSYYGKRNRRMNRIWVADVTGAPDSIFVAIPKSTEFPRGIPVAIVSTDDSDIEASDRVYELYEDVSGEFYYAKIYVNANEDFWFTFGSMDKNKYMRHGKHFYKGKEQPMTF